MDSECIHWTPTPFPWESQKENMSSSSEERNLTNVGSYSRPASITIMINTAIMKSDKMYDIREEVYYVQCQYIV